MWAGATSGRVYNQPTTAVYTDDLSPYQSSVQTGLSDLSTRGQYAGYPVRKMIRKWDVLASPQPGTSLAIYAVTSTDGATMTSTPKGAIAGQAIAGQAVVGGGSLIDLGAATPQAWEVPVNLTDVYHGITVDDQFATALWEVRSIVAEVEGGGNR